MNYIGSKQKCSNFIFEMDNLPEKFQYLWIMEKTAQISKFISSNTDTLGGTPVFMGTRVPVSILFDYFKGGDSLQDFLDNYPTVSKSVAKKIIEFSAENLLKKKAQNETAA